MCAWSKAIVVGITSLTHEWKHKLFYVGGNRGKQYVGRNGEIQVPNVFHLTGFYLS
ncbi:hypothetical protein Patl1_26221 [Pistacia atlantica]|uniref:Uncharacterized protein n=1 Tax=Pistacia atlantica TaxID=434234 RepID=A0ACC1B4N8_9ROSI|nr:hypothetical protein Patl1_26221 [Pistacia atlantica]